MVCFISSVWHHFSQHTEVTKEVPHFLTQIDFGESTAFTPHTTGVKLQDAVHLEGTFEGRISLLKMPLHESHSDCHGHNTGRESMFSL